MVHPTPNSLVRHRHSTFRQQILDVAQAEGEQEVKPDRLLNDLVRETIPAVADLVHPWGYPATENAASPERGDNACATRSRESRASSHERRGPGRPAPNPSPQPANLPSPKLRLAARDGEARPKHKKRTLDHPKMALQVALTSRQCTMRARTHQREVRSSNPLCCHNMIVVKDERGLSVPHNCPNRSRRAPPKIEDRPDRSRSRRHSSSAPVALRIIGAMALAKDAGDHGVGKGRNVKPPRE